MKIVRLRFMDEEDLAVLQRVVPIQKRVVARMHAAGVKLRSGSDTLVSFIVPGAALHRELRALENAGLSREEVLSISTRNSAEVFGEPGLGTIREGAPADLVIFGSDPTQSLDSLRDIRGVVRGGRFYSREDLDAQLARYQAHADGAVYDAVTTFLVRRALKAFRD
jgi:imidazolonepropionase-like amidohydrolase